MLNSNTVYIQSPEGLASPHIQKPLKDERINMNVFLQLVSLFIQTNIDKFDFLQTEMSHSRWFLPASDCRVYLYVRKRHFAYSSQHFITFNAETAFCKFKSIFSICPVACYSLKVNKSYSLGKLQNYRKVLCITINITFHVLKTYVTHVIKIDYACETWKKITYVTHEYMFTCVYIDMINICSKLKNHT